MTKITYKIIPNAGMPYNDNEDDYNGISIYVDGEYKTTFTGFLAEELIRDLLSGKAKEIKDDHKTQTVK